MKPMSLFRLLLVPLLLLVLPGCGLISSLTDMTQNASQLLEDISEVTRLIDSQVESGELSQEAADLIDERLDKLSEVLETAIQNNGGFLFDQVNGSVDNVFANVSELLDQIKTGILDDSLPALISQLSGELQLQTNLIASALEDIIVITFGNTMILVDKTTNSLVILLSVIFLAIGLLVFGLTLFRKDRPIKGARIFGVVFMCLYVVFFLLMCLWSGLRGYVIAGFDFAKANQAVQVLPKITGAVPERFVLGKNDRITLYGNHLNLLDSLQIRLMLNDQTKLTFPAGTVIVATRNRIILSNFGEQLNWRPLTHQSFTQQFKAKNNNVALNEVQLEKYSRQVNESLYPRLKRVSGVVNVGGTAGTVLSTGSPATRPRSTQPPVTKPIREVRGDLSAVIWGQTQGLAIENIIGEVMLNTFNLPEGSYGITAFSGNQRVESPQFIQFVYPPPPPPKPDVYPVALRWLNNIEPVAGNTVRLELEVGLLHPEEIRQAFSARITSTPATSVTTVQFPEGVIAAATGSNTTRVTSSPFTIRNPGDYTFNVVLDEQNRVNESRENNNSGSYVLKVREYVYDVTLTVESFESTEDNESGEDEYRIDFKATGPNNEILEFQFDKNGGPGQVYAVNQTKTFSGLRPGERVFSTTSGYEGDSGLRGDNDYLGGASHHFDLSASPTGNQDTRETTYTLNARDYKLNLRYVVTRRKL
ncbi:MAG: CARDB domain-containing protein [Bacteroidia bacterium]|nr:CARDB domain-containing protein [Bacteroidia bacterium]